MTDTKVDHEATATFVTNLTAAVDELEASVPGLCKAVTDRFTAEASTGSRDGSVLPIYAEANTAMIEVMGKVEKYLLAVAAKCRSDAEALSTSAKEIKDTDDDGARAIDKTDTDVSQDIKI